MLSGKPGQLLGMRFSMRQRRLPCLPIIIASE
jgi:hypothetical protein